VASQPLLPPVTARVDADGRLVAADSPLLTLQEQAGGKLGQSLAVPQLAGIARLAARLGVSITRGAVAASETEDIELWIRADPDPEGVTLTVERSSVRPPARPRWSSQPAEGTVATEGEQELLINQELKVVQVTPALVRRLGLEGADFVGRPLARLVRLVEDEDGNLPLLGALAGRHSFASQSAIIRGSEEAVLLDGAPRHQDGRFEGYNVRLRSSNAALAVTTLPLDSLLREPLASIIDQAQEIAARSEGPLRNDYAGYGSDIAAAAHHLLDLLAAISPGEAGEEGGGEPLDLAELVLDAAGLVQPQVAARSIMLDIGGAGRLPARGQARAVTQILVNLIGNAVRFSPEGGEIAIILDHGAEASVTVSDQGPGVALEDRTRIFERFEQSGTKPVELLGSASGATFRLRLPAA
jgi:signal transduction histidine kinase